MMDHARQTHSVQQPKRPKTLSEAVKMIEKLQEELIVAAVEIRCRTCSCGNAGGSARPHPNSCGGARNSRAYWRAVDRATRFLDSLEPRPAGPGEIP